MMGAVPTSTCLVISVGLVLLSTPARYPRHAVMIDENAVTITPSGFLSNAMQYANVRTPTTVHIATVKMTMVIMLLLF